MKQSFREGSASRLWQCLFESFKWYTRRIKIALKQDRKKNKDRIVQQQPDQLNRKDQFFVQAFKGKNEKHSGFLYSSLPMHSLLFEFQSQGQLKKTNKQKQKAEKK